jgi:hypothetical protein
MMSSIDGRLFFDRWTAPAQGINATTLRSHYDQVASRFDSDGLTGDEKEYFARYKEPGRPARALHRVLPVYF